jgi:hypothetical protein
MNPVCVMDQIWDYLIILDACRYDYFEKFYKQYLNGRLEKKLSLGSSTREWRDRNFTGRYDDTIYISANPFINSVKSVKGFLGADHFYRVYDLWLDYWNESKGTVLPEIVVDKSIRICAEHPDKRAIIHFVQPHAPYLGMDDVPVFNKPHSGGPAWCFGENLCDHSFKSVLLKKLNAVFYWLGIRGNLLLWRLRELLSLPPANPVDSVRRRYGKHGLQKAYEQNLKAVLAEVAKLVEHLSKTVVITADHGEMLGERGSYSHWNRARRKELLEIPWLVINAKSAKSPVSKPVNENSSGPTVTRTDKTLEERLRALGYMEQ